MKAIWKFNISVGNPAVSMPVGAEIRAVSAAQDPDSTSEFCIWAEVDTEAPLVNRQFQIYGTGHWMVGEDDCYVGTAFCASGALVWHVYEKVPF